VVVFFSPSVAAGGLFRSITSRQEAAGFFLLGVVVAPDGPEASAQPLHGLAIATPIWDVHAPLADPLFDTRPAR